MLSPTIKTTVAGIILIASTLASVASTLLVTQEITNEARIATIGLDVFWDMTCTRRCTSINWGALMPGESKITRIYVKNTGEAPIISSFNTTDWNPSNASQYISLSWNFGDVPLQPLRVRPTNFTLTISPLIYGITTFSFKITVIGTLA